MDMVAHEDVGVERAMIAVLVDGEQLEILLMIGRLFEDLLPLVPPRDDMVESAFILYPRLPWHEQRLSEEAIGVNN